MPFVGGFPLYQTICEEVELLTTKDFASLLIGHSANVCEHDFQPFFDACVLLGGSSDRETQCLAAWVAALGQRFNRGETPTVITTGCCHHSLDIFPGRTEAQIARDLLIESGIPSEAKSFVRKSRATYSAAWFTSETVFWRRVVGTTSSYYFLAPTIKIFVTFNVY